MRKRKFFLRLVGTFAVVAVLFLAGLVSAEAVPDYHKEVLGNGAVVVSHHMPDSPLVTIQLRVLSGLSNEGEYAGTGISHFIEHMIFRRMSEDGVTPVRKIAKAMGGILNGSTGLDSAEYHITVPKENFEPAMKLIVSMVMAPVFDEEGLSRERDVILKEMNMIADDPERKQIRLLFERAFSRNVYKYPIIGYRELFLELDKQDLERYHSEVYSPDRVVLGVAGGVTPDVVFSEAKRCLSGYPRAKPWDASVASEPRQLTADKVIAGLDVELGYITVGFHSIDLYSPDLYSVNVMGVVLGEGEDSLLHRILVKEKLLLHSVQAFSISPGYPGLFVIMGTGETEKLKEARVVIDDVIASLANGNLKAADLETAKNSVVFSYLASHESTYDVASSMTSSTVFAGGPSFLKSYVEGIQNVVPADVKAVAEKYLKENNSTTVYVVPESNADSFRAEQSKNVYVREEQPNVAEKTLKNGLRLIAKRTGDVPLVSVTFVARGGLMAENKGNNGISNLTAATLTKGTQKRKDREIVPAIERMGGNISAFSGLNSIGLSMDLMSGDIEKGTAIFSDVLMHPVFPGKEVEKEKVKIIAGIREQEKDIFAVGILELKRRLYGDHPYSMRIGGEIETVESMDAVEVADFYRKTVSPEFSVICVTGDIDPEKTVEDFSAVFSSWKGEDAFDREKNHLPARAWSDKSMTMKKQQSLVALGFRGVTVYDERKYALDVISALLSGSDGMLFDRMREDAGLTYTSGAVNAPQVDEGYFVLYAATTDENLEKARDKMLGAIDVVIAGEVTDEEIDSSKKRVAADHARSMEGSSAVSLTMALDTLYGLGALYYETYDGKIGEVTREDITKTAGEILDPHVAAVLEITSDL